MEQEVEFLGPVSNVYEQRVGEMEENAKSQDGGDQSLSILVLKLNKLHVLLHFSTYKLWVNVLWYARNIWRALFQNAISANS